MKNLIISLKAPFVSLMFQNFEIDEHEKSGTEVDLAHNLNLYIMYI